MPGQHHSPCKQQKVSGLTATRPWGLSDICVRLLPVAAYLSTADSVSGVSVSVYADVTLPNCLVRQR